MANILVVDDDSQAIEQSCRLIVRFGHQADFLLEPQFLLPKLEASKVDLILLDINMPDVDGLTLLEMLKSHATLREIPVIIATGETEEKLISQCFRLGAVDFVNKPIRPLELESRIRIALETREHILAIQAQKNAMERGKALTDAILDSMEDAIMVVSRADRTVLEVNRPFEREQQLGRKEIVGFSCHQSVRNILHPCFPCRPPHETCLLHLERTTREVEGRDREGNVRHSLVMTVPVRFSGHTDRVMILSREVTQAKLMEKRLKHLAFHDTLTGLPNRQLFFDRLQQSLAQSRRRERLMAVMYFDLDRFKWINDTHGHPVGDQLLQEVALRLQSCVRESDTVARMGGDEFTALLNNVEHVNQVKRVAEKILLALKKLFNFGELSFPMTSSIGIAMFPRDGETVHALMANADQALYKAKQAGRNNFQFVAEDV